MAITAGTRLGPYEVTAQIGEGGMGQVYRATDTKLKRQVAIKILPPTLAANPERMARFQREAEVLASLNHPNIAIIHGLEDSAGVKALVMELVEGEDLSQRISHGAIPLDEVLPIARQVADALESAHEQSIIHRDLKPANIKLRSDGVVKVLDFGLAKLSEPAASSPVGVSQSPTITTPAMTQAGMILGTAAYMSPEQAKGRPADRRSDVWAYGCVLFEMLAGKRAFEGDGVSDTLAAVLRSEPDWTALPATVPPGVVSVLRSCLQKDRQQRVRDIGDVALALEGAFETTAPKMTTTPLSRPRRWRVATAAIAVAVLGMIVLAVPAMQHLRETPAPAPPETRTEIVTPVTEDATSFALSPDGRQVVFTASGDSGSGLWLRSLAATTARPLSGTEGARCPLWSPDGRAIGFFAGGVLKRLDLDGGAVQTLATSLGGCGGTWNADGVIVFASNQNGPLMRVSATGGAGGAARAATTLGPQHAGHFSPWFLPDGRRFLFFVRGAPDTEGTYLGGLDDGAATRLTSGDSGAMYLPSGWLLWLRAGTLVAQRLDVTRAALIGKLEKLADGVGNDNGNRRSAVSVAATGLVAYRTSAGSQRQLTWVNRSGAALGTVGVPDGSLSNPRVLRDGHRVVVSLTVQGNTDVWLLDNARRQRVTFDAVEELFPVLSPDGGRIVFRWGRGAGLADLYYKLTGGEGAEEPLVTSNQRKTPTSWSGDGRFLLYHSISPQTHNDLWVVPMVGEHKPWVFLQTPATEAWATFSPNARWVAYASDESGAWEVYVRPFVPPTLAGVATGVARGQLPVSVAGGNMPFWRPDGKELYYLNPAGAMMAVPITNTGPTLDFGTPVALFRPRIVGGGADVQQGRQYDVALDGRFLINTVLNDAAAPITLLQNWNPDAKK